MKGAASGHHGATSSVGMERRRKGRPYRNGIEAPSDFRQATAFIGDCASAAQSGGREVPDDEDRLSG